MGFLGDVGKTVSSGASSIGGGILDMIPGVGDARAAERQNEQSIAAAREAMKFSERMSSTAYQRGMEDMKKAGLNPMLAFQQGGASAPTGVQASIASESKADFGRQAISAGLGIQAAGTAKQQADTQQAAAESAIKLNTANSAKSVADAAQSQAATDKLRAETQNVRHDSSKKKTESKLYDQASNVVDQLIGPLNHSAKSTKKVIDTFGSGVRGIQRFFNGDPRDGLRAPFKHTSGNPNIKKYMPNAKPY